MRKKYHIATIQCCSLEQGRTILTGSKTDTPITLGEITVEEYAPGFEDADGNDFATVSFD